MRLTNSKSRGSILIWTLLLGISLATVFFFFSQRLNSNVAAQRETIQYQNARLYFESYIAYIQSLDAVTLATLPDADGNIDFDGISGTLTNKTDEIVGLLDAGDDISYTADLGAGTLQVEWGHNPAEDTDLLEIDGLLAVSVPTPCGDYCFAVGIGSGSFTLSAPAGPIPYRLSATGDAVLYDTEWQLDLEYSVSFRKKLTTSLTFTP